RVLGAGRRHRRPTADYRARSLWAPPPYPSLICRALARPEATPRFLRGRRSGGLADPDAPKGPRQSGAVSACPDNPSADPAAFLVVSRWVSVNARTSRDVPERVHLRLRLPKSRPTGCWAKGGRMDCPRCHAANRQGRRFCGGCGAPLLVECPACRFGNEAEERFCGGCGAALERE